jgi:N-methylhydantoinase A
MRVATDIGGTFTDLIYLDEATGNMGMTKASTTPHNFAIGVEDTLEKSGINAADITFFVHGSTIIINALTERKGVKTGLITTRGFRDVLEITRANRPDIYNMHYTKPKPFVPRFLRLEVRERVSYTGQELESLNEEDVHRAAQFLERESVEAIAVCFLHSYANPGHEVRCGRLLREHLQHVPVTLSHEITKEWREYERTNTAVLNAYVQPIAIHYLESLERDLGEMGMGPVAHIMQSNGGIATFEMARRVPIRTCESGPVAGVIGAAVIGDLLGEPNIISLDIGGTTVKSSLVEKGVPRITTDYKIEYRRDWAGYPIKVPTVDIVEIGAGGGSIAWIDPAGSLRVGPVSAGAVPGPACYDVGGERPTVTDANLVVGRINPDYFLGGEIKVSMDRARQSMQEIADHFGKSIEEAAMGVIRLADANMINALKLVSVRRGYDPREFTMVAFGGGGSMHAAALARELRLKRVVVPTAPAVFSAWGMLMTDLRNDYIRTMVVRTDRIEPAELSRLFADMEEQATEELAAEKVQGDRMVFQRFADMRYMGQEHTVKVPLPGGQLTEKDMTDIDERFHQLHEHAYTFRLKSPVELVNFHLTALGQVEKPEITCLNRATASSAATRSVEAAYKGERQVMVDLREPQPNDLREALSIDGGFLATPTYERDLLPVGATLSGPLIVEEPAATTVVFSGQRLRCDEFGFLHIEEE